MKLSQLAAKPQLVKITVDDDDIVKKYGETVEFWIYDRQDLETFAKLAMLKEENFLDVSRTVLDMMKDENGHAMISTDQTLPPDILLRAIAKVVDSLGKSVGEVGKKEVQNSA